MDPARSRRLRRILLGLGVASVLLLLYTGAVEPYWLELTRHDVGTGSRTLRILHLTDLHFTTAGLRERRILEIVREEKPDIIVLTGDSIKADFDPRGLTDFFSSLKAPLGV